MWSQIRKRDQDIQRELQSDLDVEEEEQRERGVARDEARHAALRAFGNPSLISEQTRAVWSWNALENLVRDVRIGIRTLFRSPGFSLIAIIVMALCIGATTSLFTVMRSVLLRPLPFRDPDRLVMIYEHFRDPEDNAQGFNYNPVAPADYYDWRAQTHGFEDMAAWRYWQSNLTGVHGELPDMVQARGGSWNLFPLLGVEAVIGRTFTESEDRPDGDAVLLTWTLFERRFGGDPSIVGRQIHLNGKPYTVIGVLPKWFTYPDAKVQLWVPYAAMNAENLTHHDFHFSRVVARLRPDVSLASALNQVESVQYQLHLLNLHAPVAEDVASRTLIEDLAGDVKKPLIILLCAVGCMLLIGCLNVANLLVARSAARQKEIAVCSALGARRFTLIRAQLIASLLVSIAGGVVGVLLSFAATKWLVSKWSDLPTLQSIHADGVVLAVACALVFGAALLAGLLPAISSTSKSAIAAMETSSRAAAGSQARTALRKTLLRVEIATTVVLLIAAGLLLKSFWRLRTTDVGCVTQNVLTMRYSLPMKGYDTPQKKNTFNETLLQRVRALPGVRAAALGSTLPADGYGGDDLFTIPEHPQIAPGVTLPQALFRTADPGYFNALQIPLLSGRFFTNADRIGQPKAVIISDQLKRQYFPGESPIGKHLHSVRGDADFEIVGVVADTRYQLGQPDMVTEYFPVLNGENDPGFALAVRTTADPLSISIPVQKLIAELDPQLPVSDVLTMEQIIEQSLGNASLSASLVIGFAVMSLILASVGLYGVLSYLTTQRTPEIGVRMALGAQRGEVVRLMLGAGLRPAFYGLVLGLTASVGAVRLIQSMLYGTRPLDPAIFATVAATLLATAVLACLLPAWRASRIDPMQALRTE
ncbi:MAG TPA: ABC transporter permease [Candidatus Sulfotelmatobacter sp.]|nr:ABC transporter permease [Candidatus Sulfotelmatobacter sp.]